MPEKTLTTEELASLRHQLDIMYDHGGLPRDMARRLLATLDAARAVEGPTIADLRVDGVVAWVHRGRVCIDFPSGSIAGDAWPGVVVDEKVVIEVRSLATVPA